ncbi:MAG: hypothetical protein ACRC4L_01600 [Mycoplasma sp.]
MLGEEQWKKLSLRVRETQQWKCQFCNITIKQLKQTKWFHCHEMWDFNDETNEVSLSCLLCLCSKCHMATHFGYASLSNKHSEAFKRICKVNNWSEDDTNNYIEASFEIWSRRSNKKWTFNKESLLFNLDEQQYKIVDSYLNSMNK